jgi:hypothetical protein
MKKSFEHFETFCGDNNKKKEIMFVVCCLFGRAFYTHKYNGVFEGIN